MSQTLLDNKYNSSKVENRWYKHWLEKNYFHADAESKKEPYTIVIPPPNVTGMLTMGHVLNNTIQDILIRKARMEGKEACWIPGTDHASIATETKVIKMLEEKGRFFRICLGVERKIRWYNNQSAQKTWLLL